MTLSDQELLQMIETLDFALQPIVNIYSGVCIGYECLLRNVEEAGFRSIRDFFDTAYKEQYLYRIDIMLREKAIKKFYQLEGYSKMRLFYNIDNRVLSMPDYKTGLTTKILQKYRLNHNNVCFEISERHEFSSFAHYRGVTRMYKQQGFRIAIDDFGAGFSGLQLLYHTESDFIKIDRFFISNISNDLKKKLFVSHILELAHTLGIKVIAEGVETWEEFYTCKEIGCDMIQGYLVQRPTRDISALKTQYDNVRELSRKHRRAGTSDKKMINRQTQFIEPVCRKKHSVIDLFQMFRNHKTYSCIPVVNSNDEPIGVIRENDLKEYVYSPFGKEILKNKASHLKNSLQEFTTILPVASLHQKIEKILEIFSLNRNPEGVLMTENGKYKGILTASALLNILNEKNLALARDQNPLTRLPGNNLINEKLVQSLGEENDNASVIYFDFDNFKPFNDTYGFRTGDRAIQIFSDILRELSNQWGVFVGHLGGDDFIVVADYSLLPPAQCRDIVKRICSTFRENASSLYNDEDRARGFMNARDREGNQRRFPLLSVSAAIIFAESPDLYTETLSRTAASLKKEAKDSEQGIAVMSI
jgi:diguanylate cyclase (GGDEF)-like protein